jgi:superfamily II DNA or RNA helicase
MVHGGLDKDSKKRVLISTWQSIYKLPKKWFAQFDAVFMDEVHLGKADSLRKITHKLEDCRWRIGTTGTLDDCKTHHLILQGLFGVAYQPISTKQLIDEKKLSPLTIKCIVLRYNDIECKTNKKSLYQDEIKYIIGHERRNKFICNLATRLKGNTLLLFRYVNKHGKIIHELIEEKASNKRKVFFIYGKTEAEVREEIRHITESEKDAILVASIGVFSTGINIKNLHNIIFASPSKSKIQVLQSIGRVLRKADAKNNAVLYDIVDDLSYKSYKNFAIRHFMNRVDMYNKEYFNYTINGVNIS